MKRYKRKQIKAKIKQPCNICQIETFLVEHHIHGRAINNPHHRSNLCYICSNCHTEIHKGWIIVEGWFQTTDGLKLIWHKKHEESITGMDAYPPLW